MVLFPREEIWNGGWLECGLEADSNGIRAFFYVYGDEGRTTLFKKTYPATFNEFHTMRFNVETNIMAFT